MGRGLRGGWGGGVKENEGLERNGIRTVLRAAGQGPWR